MAQWRSSGQSAADFCEGRDFTASTLKWWASRIPRLQRARAKQAPDAPPLSLMRVVTRESSEAMSPMPVAAVSPSPSPRRPGAGVTLDVAGTRVLLDVGFDRESLAAVLEVLGVRAAVQP